MPLHGQLTQAREQRLQAVPGPEALVALSERRKRWSVPERTLAVPGTSAPLLSVAGSSAPAGVGLGQEVIAFPAEDWHDVPRSVDLKRVRFAACMSAAAIERMTQR